MANGGSQPVTIINNFGSAAEMTGATSEADGTGGTVPAPVAGDEGKFLRGDGSWQTVAGGGEASPGPLTFGAGPSAGTGASGGITETSSLAGFITLITGDPVDNSSPFNAVGVTYGTPREDEEDIPVQLTPANQKTAELNWWVAPGAEQFTIRATDLEASTTYSWTYRLY